MANLLNVIPQANNKNASPVDKNPAKPEEKELKDLFQQKLAENLSSEVSGEKAEKAAEKAIDELPDLGEVALAAGAVQGAKLTPIDLKPTVQNESKTPIQAQKLALSPLGAEIKTGVGAKTPTGIQVINPQVLKTPENKNPSLVKSAEAVSANPAVNPALASMMAGQEMLVLPEEHAFEIDSLDVKTASPKEASSKLSTADFLNLREISQNPVKPAVAVQSSALTNPNQVVPLQATGAVIGMKATQKQDSDKKLDDQKDLSAAMNGLAPAHSNQQIFGKTLDATVSQATGQKPILSPETLTQIGNQVNLMGQARQDGEIKIRLRPDHLGELQMSVRTQGQNVSVQIKAENNEAKKIIEDSLGALREHLSLQNLSLANIDVVTQPTAHSNLEQAQMRFDSNQNFNQSTQQGERNGSQDGSSQSGREYYGENPSLIKAQPAAMIRPKMTDTSRLDLIA